MARALVAENERGIRLLLKTLLQRQGSEVVEAAAGGFASECRCPSQWINHYRTVGEGGFANGPVGRRRGYSGRLHSGAPRVWIIMSAVSVLVSSVIWPFSLAGGVFLDNSWKTS
jgi:hypothetical protein